MKENICLILSFHDRAVQHEWMMERAIRDKLNIHFIFLNPDQWHIEKYMRLKNIPCTLIKYHGKKDIPRATALVYRYLVKHKITVVHTHLFDANLVGLTAAWLARIKKRIYTRHHSDFHHRFHVNAVKYDRYCNRLATDIIAISKVVQNVLIDQEHVLPSKVHLIHHGFDLDEFKNVKADEANEMMRKYNPSLRHPVIGVISRYEESKGLHFIINAFKDVLKLYPEALLVLANTRGSYASEIKKLLHQLPQESYCEILFEYNLFSLYRMFDVFVHAPVYKEYEAFGQVYVESLASGIPSVFTISGVANEFIKDNRNALIAGYADAKSLYDKIILLLQNADIRNHIIENGRKDIEHLFGIELYYSKLKNLYLHTTNAR